MNYLVRDREVIFNLAGQVSHIDSMRDPYTDLEINCRSQLTILEACRYNNPGVKVVFAGTRQVYGRPDSLPVNEKHLVRPTDVNGINKAAGEYYHLVYNNVFGVRACSLRLTNVYGPRQLIRHNRQGFIGWFIRLAIEGRRRSRSTATARSCAISSTSTMRPTRSCARARSTRATARCSTSAATSRSAIATLTALLVEIAGIGPRRVRRLAGREEGDRHRRLLRRFDQASAHAPAGSRRSRCATACADDRVLPAALSIATSISRAARRSACDAAARAVPVAGAARGRRRRPRRDRARRRQRLVRARARGRGVRARVRRGVPAPRTRSASGTGTDAIALILRALGIGPGDEVITTPLSAAYTALAIMMAGARPVFADIDPARLTIDPAAIERRDHAAHAGDPAGPSVRPAGRHGRASSAIAARARPGDRRGLLPGAPRDRAPGGRSARSASPGAFSFYPTKNLGALGDGGAVVTNDARARRPRSSGCATADRTTATIIRSPA